MAQTKEVEQRVKKQQDDKLELENKELTFQPKIADRSKVMTTPDGSQSRIEERLLQKGLAREQRRVKAVE